MTYSCTDQCSGKMTTSCQHEINGLTD